MVQAALCRAQGDMLERYPAPAVDDTGKLLDRQASTTDDDMAHLVAAHHASSEDARQLVSNAFDRAQTVFPAHQCTFEFHSPRRPPPPSHTATGTPSYSLSLSLSLSVVHPT